MRSPADCKPSPNTDICLANAYLHPGSNRYPSPNCYHGGYGDTDRNGNAQGDGDADHLSDSNHIRDANAHADCVCFAYSYRNTHPRLPERDGKPAG